MFLCSDNSLEFKLSTKDRVIRTELIDINICQNLLQKVFVAFFSFSAVIPKFILELGIKAIMSSSQSKRKILATRSRRQKTFVMLRIFGVLSIKDVAFDVLLFTFLITPNPYSEEHCKFVYIKFLVISTAR